MAKDMPVLPLVASIILLPGLSSPFFSAISIMYRAIISFMLPLGFSASTLANIVDLVSFILASFTRGAFPIRSNTLFAIFYLLTPIIFYDSVSLVHYFSQQAG